LKTAEVPSGIYGLVCLPVRDPEKALLAKNVPRAIYHKRNLR
jgi:hypothetical protein